MIKGSLQEEDITIINIYVPNIGADNAELMHPTQEHLNK